MSIQVTWHGWQNNGIQIHVGPFPNRKGIALSVVEGTAVRVVAYFRNQEDAEYFMRQFDALLGVPPEHRGGS